MGKKEKKEIRKTNGFYGKEREGCLNPINEILS
jgi:hypothetical protein